MKKIFCLAALFALGTFPANAEDELTAVISGVVSTTAKKPMPGVQVILLDQSDMQLGIATTDPHGAFHFKHTVCHECTLEVLPALDTHYACAVIENIPGNTNRNFLLSLQRGFDVSGRVMADRKGAKGISLRAISLDDNKDGKQVHDGGLARTARNGSFSMILTPGHKQISVMNDSRPEFERKTELKVEVTGDTTLPDIQLVPKKTYVKM
ncbi:MAG TPA: hypothetical protein V6C76_17050 [Drouetiella sp.]